MTNKLTLDEYQAEAEKTALYRTTNRSATHTLIYTALGLNGEAGECAEHIKKYMRDGTLNHEALARELGDVLWYLAMFASELEYDLSEIAQINIDKLKDRHSRGTIGGSGDVR